MILKKYSYFLKKLTRLWTKARMLFKRLYIHHTETHLLHPVPSTIKKNILKRYHPITLIANFARNKKEQRGAPTRTG